MEAKEIKGLMEAYASIYSPQVIDESECECEEDEKEEDEKSMEMKGKKKNKKKELANEDLQQKVGQALDAAAKNPVIKAIGKVIAPVGKGRGTVTKAEQERKIKEEVDLFDYLLEYLVAEGYADTNKAALAIMANMSEEWKQDIVEAKYGTKAGRKALAKKIRKGEEIGKSGPGTGFKAVEKAAKEGGARDPQAVAAAAMWKAHGGKKG